MGWLWHERQHLGTRSQYILSRNDRKVQNEICRIQMAREIRSKDVEAQTHSTKAVEDGQKPCGCWKGSILQTRKSTNWCQVCLLNSQVVGEETSTLWERPSWTKRCTFCWNGNSIIRSFVSNCISFHVCHREGSDGAELIPLNEVKTRCPELVIDYLAGHLVLPTKNEEQWMLVLKNNVF